MNILGISAFYHDSAAALISDGHIVAAAQEERFSRKKHDAGFPASAIQYVLDEAQLDATNIDYVAFYEKPFLKFERLVETYLANAPRGFKSFSKAMPLWLREKLYQKTLLLNSLEAVAGGLGNAEKLLFSEHHYSHAASAFYPSPFNEALVLTLDGVGEWATTTVALGNGESLEMLKELHFPHSLGLLYSAFTYYTGFRVNSGEYKLMGLAPYGEPKYTNLILDNLVDVKPDGTFRLDQRYFNYAAGLTMTNERFAELFGQPVRQAESTELSQFHMDIAASVQAVTEHIVLRLSCHLADEYQQRNLCLAGGVALNCVANGKILRSGKFDNVWVQPAAGDAGGALGAALAAWHYEFGKPRITLPAVSRDAMQGSYLGPRFSNQEIATEFDTLGAVYTQHSREDTLQQTAQALADGMAVGWFQGRMEFGPRALGGRSIIADPRSADMQKNLNLKIKFRESFRPFAPSVLREHVAEWFEHDTDSPYMLMVAPVQDSRRTAEDDGNETLFGIDRLNTVRSEVPAITHVDYSARLQTVHADTNSAYHELISRFNALTGCPMLVNTSFNVRGEPIVCTPEDAYRCFMGTGLDMLVCEDTVLLKTAQPDHLIEDYRNKYALD